MLMAREDVIEACLIQKKIIKVKGEETNMEQGPCRRIDGNKCEACISPAARWKNGNCNLATHLISFEDEKQFVNPIKQSKRGK